MPTQPKASRRLHTLGFACAALLLAIVSGVVIDGAIRFADAAQAVSQGQQALNRLAGVLSTQRVAVAALRGHLLGVDDNERGRYLRAIEQLRLDLEGLDALAAREAMPATAVTQLREVIAARSNLSQLVLDQFERAGLDTARATLRDSRATALDLQVEQQVDQLLRAQSTVLERRARSFERSSRRLLITASLGIPLSLLILAAIYLLLRQEIDTRRRAEQAAADWHAELNQSVDRMGEVSRDMQRLSAYASLLQTCDNTDEALEFSRVSLGALLPDCAGTVFLFDGDEPEARAAIAWGEHAAPSSATPAPHDCWAVRRAQPFATDPTTAELRCQHIASGRASAADAATLCLPLNAQGVSLGILYLSGPAPMRGHALAETAAEQLSLALANLRMREQLRDQSIRDPLTGLFNRRYLDESLQREQARCQRRGLPLAVMMLDVDHFKRFNDAHGHPGGDALLAAVGRLMRQLSRAGDIPCRYGGEEFTLILPETDVVAAVAVAEKLRHAIAGMTVVHEGKPLSSVTASMGIAVLPDCAAEIDELLEAADAALYEAKASGRNRVVAAPARVVAQAGISGIADLPG